MMGYLTRYEAIPSQPTELPCFGKIGFRLIGYSNRFDSIEANQTFAETFYFWYFLLRIDSETLFS